MVYNVSAATDSPSILAAQDKALFTFLSSRTLKTKI